MNSVKSCRIDPTVYSRGSCQGAPTQQLRRTGTGLTTRRTNGATTSESIQTH
jgi:hypothetical protein